MIAAPSLTEQLVARAGAGFDGFWDAAGRTGFCRHPVQLRVGEVGPVLPVACRNRRAAACPTCAAVYRGDTWQLVVAGLRGGKGVPEAVAGHPAVFVTLTAPSFGPVHAARGGTVCRGRRPGAETCPHGQPLCCSRRHGPEDPAVGTPLCPQCFRYADCVMWNHAVPELWRRTTIAWQRALARRAGLSSSGLRRRVRLSFTKVAEYQARGAVHLHIVLRADGVAPGEPTRLVEPPAWCTAALLAAVVHETLSAVRAPLRRLPGVTLAEARWGVQHDVRVIRTVSGRVNPVAVAAYVAKYATKAAEVVTDGLTRPIRSPEQLAARRLAEHPARLVATCLHLAAADEELGAGLRRWAHMLGFGGHFSTRSRRYSVTLGALRAARAAWRAEQRRRRGLPDRERTWAGRAWHFAGMGWANPAEQLLVDTAARGRLLAAELAREQRRAERSLGLAA